ncbi:MAG: hypothetical protein PGN11_05895 [Quadrisphaera sp.]
MRAAEREAWATLRRAFYLDPELVAHVENPSPWVLGVVERYGHRRSTRRWCPHLHERSPEVTWLLVARARLECFRCHLATQSHIAGTEEDRRCDVCRRLIEVGRVHVLRLVVGHTIVSVGHCGACTRVVRRPTP